MNSEKYLFRKKCIRNSESKNYESKVKKINISKKMVEHIVQVLILRTKNRRPFSEPC